jgi:hypothetical protein
VDIVALLNASLWICATVMPHALVRVVLLKCEKGEIAAGSFAQRLRDPAHLSISQCDARPD